ncbi:MAG: hypothetical protein KME09_21060 [Pleurocapsa minor HA4230-MV1]|jgi:hypothetical protein|nr:hypothetical protein [Pleurocapsa minor HA4230-MV1]
MSKKTPEEIREILIKIKSQSDLILVGGHAINLWASAYRDKIPQLNKFLPFSSEDLDFIGGRIEAVEIQRILGGDLTLNKNFDPSPNTGVLITDDKNQALRIDFLASVYGLGDDEVINSAINFCGQDKLIGVNLKVLNPILCLEGKLKSYTGLPQAGRQDKKHLQISLLIVNQYIKDVCIENDPRDGLKLIEKMLKTAKSDAGLKVWLKDDIDIIKTVPLDIIDTLEDPKWEKFRTIRFSQAIQEIADKRVKYQEIDLEISLRQKSIDSRKNLEIEP